MNRAEIVLNAVEKQLERLPTTQNRIERDRVYPPENLPALSVNQGAESPAVEPNTAFQDVILDVDIEIKLKSSQFTTQLNKIKSEVYGALMKNRQLDLSFVFNTYWRGDSNPDTSGDAEIKTASCVMRFQIHYRHSYLSKES